MRAVWLSGIFLVLAVAAPLAADTRGTDPDEGVLGSIRLRIPEPMVFDLVRPLGATRGEFEINSLFGKSFGRHNEPLEWAPEVEYAFLDGHAIEFELPAEGASITHYKLALQSTLPAPWELRFTHGWQGIVERERHTGEWQTDQLYITGFRFNSRWSSLSMHGVRLFPGSPDTGRFLANNTLFYEGKYTTYGLETNLALARRSGSHVRVVPQVHFHLGERVHLQMGAGVEKRPTHGYQPYVAWRLIREL